MSRIHEALKKAAEERAAKVVTEVEGAVAEVPSEPKLPPMVRPEAAVTLPIPPAAPAPKPSSRVTASPAATPGFSYEELLKRCVQAEWQLDPANSVFLNSRPGEGGPERFRTLRSRLYKIASTRKLKKVLITSGVAAEGKTFVAANLAQSIIQQPELRVLLIDADLRSSRQHLLFGTQSCPGLSDYLRGDADEYAVTQKGSFENLFLIPGGNLVSNPSELLLSDRMKQLFNTVAPVFDWIIIDSPPTLPVHDASVLADMVDGVLFVIRAGSTDAEIVERTAAEFQGKNLLGVVLNRVQKADSYGEEYQNYYGERD
ncbi:MAG TPA: CpsD/CapB family tyrosine-protein kinase [Candidatus Acidoferrum sp.]|nr:CpsD/CapB family tyrosine-protein kinase [Candidatus Acidoferrum sp.]